LYRHVVGARRPQYSNWLSHVVARSLVFNSSRRCHQHKRRPPIWPVVRWSSTSMRPRSVSAHKMVSVARWQRFVNYVHFSNT
jgi:hypothetical protein